jgi:phage shock protein PspC (stress-responsive transcriptional regulator)
MEASTPTVDTEPTPSPPGSSLPPPRPGWLDVPLSRDRAGGMIGGVVAGLARAYGFDRRLSRIATVISAIALPPVFFAYLVAWMVLPKDAGAGRSLRQLSTDRRRLPLAIAVVVVLSVLTVGEIDSWFGGSGFSWGVGLIAVGVLLWLLAAGERGGVASSPMVPGTPVPTASSMSGVAPAEPAPGVVTGLYHPPLAAPLVARRDKRPVALVVLATIAAFIAAAAIGRGLGWWGLAPLGTIVVTLSLLVAGVLAAMVVNRSWWTAVFLVLLLPPLVGLLIVRPDVSGGIGDRVVRPVSRAEAAEPRELGIGELTLDLTDVPLGAEALHVDGRVGVGHLEVIVPDGAALVIDADLGTGSVEVDGDEVLSGFRHRETVRVDGRPGGGVLELDLEIDAGLIEVVRSSDAGAS